MTTLIIALFWTLASLAHAEEPERGLAAPTTEKGRRVALVIGNSDYQHTAPLVNPRHDAEDMARLLRELGFEVVEGHDLGHAAMIRTLREFAVAVRRAEVGLAFYAGHGLQVEGENYMVPVDAELDSAEAVEFEAVSMDRIVAELERDPRLSILILDACRNNPLARSLARALGTTSRAASAGEGLAAINAVSPESLIVFSTQPGATAADGTGRNSPFTAALLEHLALPGVDVESAIKLVTRDVIAYSGGSQVPFRSSSLTREYVLRPGEASGQGVESVGLTPAVPAAPASLEDELKRLEESQRARIEVEQQLAIERQARIDAATEPILTRARELWKQTAKLAEKGGPEAEIAVMRFIEQFQAPTIQVDGEIIDVVVPEVILARNVVSGWSTERSYATEPEPDPRNRRRLRVATGLAATASALWVSAAVTGTVYNNPPAGAPPDDDVLLAANRASLVGAGVLTAAAGGMFLTVEF